MLLQQISLRYSLLSLGAVGYLPSCSALCMLQGSSEWMKTTRKSDAIKKNVQAQKPTTCNKGGESPRPRPMQVTRKSRRSQCRSQWTLRRLGTVLLILQLRQLLPSPTPESPELL